MTAGALLRARSGILYVRASLSPFAASLRQQKSVIGLLRQGFSFEEVFAPDFQGARPFWRARPSVPPRSRSGALGRLMHAETGAVASAHPSHSFVGVGTAVGAALAVHDAESSCFEPIATLAKEADFSMLLLACLDSSPGFSTVHAVQWELGLSKRHWIRHLLRWDWLDKDGMHTKRAAESPGCSLSFGKFYQAYRDAGNLVEGEFLGQRYLFVPSARSAMDAERRILRSDPYFVDCGRWSCTTCRLRWY